MQENFDMKHKNPANVLGKILKQAFPFFKVSAGPGKEIETPVSSRETKLNILWPQNFDCKQVLTKDDDWSVRHLFFICQRITMLKFSEVFSFTNFQNRDWKIRKKISGNFFQSGHVTSSLNFPMWLLS